MHIPNIKKIKVNAVSIHIFQLPALKCHNDNKNGQVIKQRESLLKTLTENFEGITNITSLLPREYTFANKYLLIYDN